MVSFNINSALLKNAFEEVIKVLPKRPPMSILGGCLFTVKDATLRITATDLENQVSVEIPIHYYEDPFAFCLEIKQIFETLKTIEGDVTILFEEGVFILKTYSGEYRVNTMDALDFPVMKTDNEISSFVVNSEVLTTSLGKVLPFVSTDHVKIAMCGVLIMVGKNGITFCATDAHRLCEHKGEYETEDNPTAFILSHKAAEMINTNLKKYDEDTIVKVTVNHNNLSVKYKDTEIIGRLVDARFPEYKNVIPTETKCKVTVNKKDLQNAIKRLDLYAPSNNHLIKLEFSESVICLSSEDIALGKSAKEYVNGYIENPIDRIGVNARYLSDLINNCETEDIVMKLEKENAAFLVCENKEQSNMLQLQMPIMLNTL